MTNIAKPQPEQVKEIFPAPMTITADAINMRVRSNLSSEAPDLLASGNSPAHDRPPGHVVRADIEMRFV